jgi:hypothetical protein
MPVLWRDPKERLARGDVLADLKCLRLDGLRKLGEQLRLFGQYGVPQQFLRIERPRLLGGHGGLPGVKGHGLAPRFSAAEGSAERRAKLVGSVRDLGDGKGNAVSSIGPLPRSVLVQARRAKVLVVHPLPHDQCEMRQLANPLLETHEGSEDISVRRRPRDYVQAALEHAGLVEAANVVLAPLGLLFTLTPFSEAAACWKSSPR